MYTKIKSTGIWHDTVKNCRVPLKTANSLYFPSKSEYEVYLYLHAECQSEDIKLKVHPKVGVYGRSWVIDFALVSTNMVGARKLALINNQINHTKFDYLERIYIEYKGIQDDNFIDKMTHFCKQSPTLASTISLISNSTSAFGCENLLSKGIITKPIVSVPTFKKWWERVIVDKQTNNSEVALCHVQ